jgi:hypothetical protein
MENTKFASKSKMQQHTLSHQNQKLSNIQYSTVHLLFMLQSALWFVYHHGPDGLLASNHERPDGLLATNHMVQYLIFQFIHITSVQTACWQCFSREILC